jgi:hypothetical protein
MWLQVVAMSSGVGSRPLTLSPEKSIFYPLHRALFLGLHSNCAYQKPTRPDKASVAYFY